MQENSRDLAAPWEHERERRVRLYGERYNGHVVVRDQQTPTSLDSSSSSCEKDGLTFPWSHCTFI